MLYSRSGDGRLSTLHSVEYAASERYVIDHFRSMFRLTNHWSANKKDGCEYHWDGFLREARLTSEDLVGRQEELSTVKRWLKSRKHLEMRTLLVGLCVPARVFIEARWL